MQRCPQCGTEVAEDDFQCARCELFLGLGLDEVEAEDVVTEPSISVVQALLGPAERKLSREIPLPPTRAPAGPAPLGEEKATAEFEALVGPQLVPRIIAGLDIAGKLDGFEAYVASFVDGALGPAGIATAARVAEIEVQAVLRTLRERRVIEIVPRPPSVPLAGPAALNAAASPREPNPVPRPESTRKTFASPSPRKVPGTSPAPSAPPAPPLPRVRGPLEAPVAPAQEREENVLQRAVSLERSGEIDGAIHVLKRGIARVKNPAPLYNRLALILLQQRRDYAQAEELLRKALEMEPDHPVYQQNLYKVIGLAASGSGSKRGSAGGLLGRLIGRKP